MNSPKGGDWIPLLTVLGPLFAAFAGGFVTYLVARSKNEVDMEASRQKGQSEAQGQITGGFQLLVKDLREQVTILTSINRDQTNEIVALRAEVKKLGRHMARLELLLEEHGITLPVEPTDNGGPPLT